MTEATPIRPREQLPTARIAFPQQLKILRAYAAASGSVRKPVGNDEVADIVKLSKTTVPLANPFFSAVGLIEKADGKKYVPANEVFQFFEVHGWGSEHEERASHELAPLLQEAWFAKALLPKVAFGSVSTSEALQTLARTAGVQPDSRQLRMLLDFLEAAGLIEIDGDRIQKGNNSQSPRPEVQGAADETPTPESNVSAPASPAPSSLDSLPMLVQGLIDKLPDESDGWDVGAAKRWLDLAEATFPMAYDYDAADNAPNGGDPRASLFSPAPSGGDVP
jgi:hypothetical protein